MISTGAECYNIILWKTLTFHNRRNECGHQFCDCDVNLQTTIISERKKIISISKLIQSEFKLSSDLPVSFYYYYSNFIYIDKVLGHELFLCAILIDVVHCFMFNERGKLFCVFIWVQKRITILLSPYRF